MFQQTIGISMGTNCAPLFVDLFLQAYEADFLQRLLKNKDRKLAQTSNSRFRYIDDFLSLNNARFCDYLYGIYELEVKDTTDTQKSASYLDLHLEIDNGGILITKLYDKHNDFIFPIVKFPFISSNILASPAYGVYISQLKRDSRACAHYIDFLDRAHLLTQKLRKQGYVAPMLKPSLQKLYGRRPIFQMTMDLLLFT